MRSSALFEQTQVTDDRATKSNSNACAHNPYMQHAKATLKAPTTKKTPYPRHVKCPQTSSRASHDDIETKALRKRLGPLSGLLPSVHTNDIDST